MPQRPQDPLDELAILLERNNSSVQEALVDVAESIIRNDNTHGAALDRFRVLMGQTMALSDMLGRRRTVLWARFASARVEAVARIDILAAELIPPTVPRVTFDEAVVDIAHRTPEIAQTGEAVADAYLNHHAFAVARSADINLTERVQKAIRDALDRGRTVDEATQDILAEAEDWSRGYAETVARTNMASAYSAGRIQQSMENPEIREILPAWEFNATGDSSTRENHQAADGFLAAKDDPRWANYYPPMGYNCVLGDTLVSGRFVAALKADYAGPIIEIETRNGARLSVTVNHPVMTRSGWKAAGLVGEGDDLLCDFRMVDFLDRGHRTVIDPAMSRRAIDDQEMPRAIEDVYDAMASHRTLAFGQAGDLPLDFYGDAKFMQGQIDVVGADGMFAGYADALRNQEVSDFVDVQAGASPARATRHSRGLASALVHGNRATRRGLPRGSALSANEGGTLLDDGPLEELRLGPSADMDAFASEECRKRNTADPDFVRQFLHAGAGSVAFDKVVSVRRREFIGHVYDLQSVGGWIIANGICISNCRCIGREVDIFELEERGLLTLDGRVIPVVPVGITSGAAHPDKNFGGVRPDRRIYGR